MNRSATNLAVICRDRTSERARSQVERGYGRNEGNGDGDEKADIMRTALRRALTEHGFLPIRRRRVPYRFVLCKLRVLQNPVRRQPTGRGWFFAAKIA